MLFKNYFRGEKKIARSIFSYRCTHFLKLRSLSEGKWISLGTACAHRASGNE